MVSIARSGARGKRISSNLRGPPALPRRRILLKPSGERPTVLSSSTENHNEGLRRMITDTGIFFKVLGLFAATHDGRQAHFRETRDWINSVEGQALLAANGIEWWAKEDDEIAEEEAAEAERQRTDPQCVLIHNIAFAVFLTTPAQREGLLQAIHRWEQSLGGEFESLKWINTGRNAADMLGDLLCEIHEIANGDADYDPTPMKRRNPFRLV
jgi:hypothetical protein